MKMASRGLFGDIADTMTSPLWLGGAALVSGEGMGGAMRGLQMGSAMQEQQRQNQQRQQRENAFTQLLAKTPEASRPFLTALGPEQGLSLLAKQAMPNPTDDQREYNLARSQGFDGTFLDYVTRVKQAGANQNTINMPKLETEYDRKLGGELANEFVSAQKGAATAQRDLGNLDVMRSVLNDPNVYTGTGGNAVHAIKKGAQSLFGIDVKGVAGGEVMQNLASEIAVGNKQKLPGPMSDADRQFLVDMAPNLTKSPEGNRQIIELGMAHKRWEVERGRAAREYAASHGGRLDAGFYEFVGRVDQKFASEFSGIVGKMRESAERMAPRSPAAGTPLADPLGVR
jgi:hypothetical protein